MSRRADAVSRHAKPGVGGRFGGWLRMPLAPVAGGLVVLALAQTGVGGTVLRLTGLAQAAPAYSALYFTNVGTLPSKIPAGRFSIALPFAVNNASRTDRTYQWTAEVVTAGITRRAASGKLSVRVGATAVAPLEVTGVCSDGSLEVEVQLAAPVESINFRTVCDA
jgi:hypothetical protein